MSEQVAPNTEASTTPAPAAPAPVVPTATTPVQTGGKTFTESELEAILKERLDREKAKRERAAQEAADKAAQEAAAKNGEWEKVAKQNEAKLAELQAQLHAREVMDLKRSIAEKIGLPVSLAARLVGETEKDLETDAKALLETLPKPQAPASPAKPQPGPVAPANPGANGQQGETLAAQRARLHGAKSANAFDPALNRNQGGGVIFNVKPAGSNEQ